MIDTLVRQCKSCNRDISGTNIYWKNPGKGRRRQAACRACKYRRTNRYKREQRRASAVSYTPIPRGIMATTSGNGKNAPWNLYKVKEDAQGVWQEFQVALDSTRTPCHRDDAFVEFEDPRYSDEGPKPPMPTTEQAAAMCAGCPLLAMCNEFAEREKPDWGIHGGRIWIGGKVQK